jgi:outer membrane protein OmpA-like peptidoglycan-associated protein
MRFARLVTAAALLAVAGLALPSPAEAQFLDRIKKTAERAVEDETANQVDRLVRNAIRCAIDDPVCIQEAEAAGEDVIFVDEDGEIIADEEGAPITDREEAMAKAPPPPAPGEGAWANYDFVPGDEILFFDDYSADEVGDFPRRWELIGGSWDVVDWEGTRYLRALAGGSVAIVLPRTLPERFTIEVPVSLLHGNAYIRLATGRAYQARPANYEGSVVSVEFTQVGIRARGAGPDALAPMEHRFGRDGVTPLRVMADGEYMKVYVGDKRMANVPNAVFPRGDTLFVAVSATAERPALLGPVRIAGGGRDLYDRLERDGRVATQGILFATNSDRIRPESTPTLDEIGEMLVEHPELRLGIEGHTDAEGADDYNQDLSERRAAAVKRHLVEAHGIEEERLETAGFGETRPVEDNATAEGRQQNRRVELERL